MFSLWFALKKIRCLFFNWIEDLRPNFTIYFPCYYLFIFFFMGMGEFDILSSILHQTEYEIMLHVPPLFHVSLVVSIIIVTD